MSAKETNNCYDILRSFCKAFLASWCTGPFPYLGSALICPVHKRKVQSVLGAAVQTLP